MDERFKDTQDQGGLMRTRTSRLSVLFLFAAWLILACDLGTLTGGASAKPTILIQSPANGSQFQEGAEITIQSVATDASGIKTVDLIVDGAVVRTDKPSAGQTGLLVPVAQKWQATAGTHTIGVRAYNTSGTPGDIVSIAIVVSASAAQVPSPISGLPPAAPTRTGGGTGRIAFVTNRDGSSAIYVMNADGSQPNKLISMPRDLNNPAWSPDGAHIAFTSNRDGHDEIYVMNANGGYPKRLTDHPAGSGYAAWSPDGARLAFESERDGKSEIYVMNVDGSQVTRLTNNSAYDGSPTWSPDGKRIAFSSDRDGVAEIYVMNADGSQPVRLTNTTKNQYWSNWSPDGTRIVFGSNRDGNWEIYVMNADGSQQTQLTHSAAQDEVPAWSADGTQIYFTSNRDGNWEIYAMKPDGSQQINISNNAAIDFWTSSQPQEASADALKTPPVSAITPWPTYTPTPTRTVTPTVAAGATAAPVAASIPPPTATVAAQPTDTPAPPAPTSTITPAPPTATLALPGLYVTAMGLDQAQPAHGQNVNFTVSFVNTGSGDLNVRWKVYIYRADNPAKSNTESAVVPATFPPGKSDNQLVPMNFKLGSTGNDCDYFFARVDTLDVNNKSTDLTTTDGKVFEKGFSVCK